MVEQSIISAYPIQVNALHCRLSPRSRSLRYFNPLHHHGGGCSTAVADGCNTILPRLQLVEQGGQNSRARAPKRMTKSNGSTARIDVGGI